MFVPSLSCKMMHLYTNGAKKVAFLYRDLTVEVPVRAYTLMQKRSCWAQFPVGGSVQSLSWLMVGFLVADEKRENPKSVAI